MDKGFERKFSFESEEAYKEALKKSPKKDWVKKRSLGGNKSSIFVPVQTIEAIADNIFSEWDVIDEKYEVFFNEILCTVKIKYIPSYPYAEERVCTGVGAKPIQCDKDSIPSLFPKGKKVNALEYNAGAARGSAICNAFSTLGNLFGRNLNRNVEYNYKL